MKQAAALQAEAKAKAAAAELAAALRHPTADEDNGDFRRILEQAEEDMRQKLEARRKELEEQSILLMRETQQRLLEEREAKRGETSPLRGRNGRS